MGLGGVPRKVHGIPGKVEGERYKKSPELVRAFVAQAHTFAAPAKFIVFKRWDQLDERDEPAMAIFLARPDVLSGLFTLANFAEAETNGVYAPFSAGCGSIVQHPYLERTKAVLERWARDNGIVVLDAGQSELYGCTGPEFTDEHHAAPECFARVMGRFWRDWGSEGLPPGLYLSAVGHGGGRFVVFTMATSVPEETGPALSSEFQKLGVADVRRYHLTREEALKPGTAAILDGASAVWFSGGDQARHTAVLLGTPDYDPHDA